MINEIKESLDKNLCDEIVPVFSDDVRIYWDGDKREYYIVSTINHRMHEFRDVKQ